MFPTSLHSGREERSGMATEGGCHQRPPKPHTRKGGQWEITARWSDHMELSHTPHPCPPKWQITTKNILRHLINVKYVWDSWQNNKVNNFLVFLMALGHHILTTSYLNKIQIRSRSRKCYIKNCIIFFFHSEIFLDFSDLICKMGIILIYLLKARLRNTWIWGLHLTVVFCDFILKIW